MPDAVQYSLWPAAALSAFAGAAFGGRLTLEYTGGTTVDSTDYDPAQIVGATFRFRF